MISTDSQKKQAAAFLPPSLKAAAMAALHMLSMLPMCLFSHSLAAQGMNTMFPQKSPRASVSQVVGVCTVTIEYHRPGVRNRPIWGDLVPFGELWRTGANEATTISFTRPVKVAGNPVPAGKYALFTIPGRERWTIILNARHQQMGAFEYNPKEDVLRFEVRPTAVSFSEYLTFEIYPASDSSAYVDLDWERLRIYFLVEVDLDKAVEARMKEILAKAKPTDWLPRCEAAQYLLDSEKDMPQAMRLIEESMNIRQTPQNMFVKAQILRWAGSAADGYRTLDQALELADRQKSPPATIMPMEQMRSQWQREDQRR